MGKYKKVEEAQKCKECIKNMVRKYFDEDKIPNSGQLKFFKELLIRRVAISTFVKVNNPQKRVIKYLEETILNSNDEVLFLFGGIEDDRKLNEIFERAEISPEYAYKTPEGINPVLLLEKARDEMEKAFIKYIKVDEEEKGEVYLEWMLSIAFYEIFLRELWVEANKHLFALEDCVDFEEKLQNIKQIQEKMHDLRYKSKEEKLTGELIAEISGIEKELRNIALSAAYVRYFIMQQIHILAMTRTVIILEGVTFYAYGELSKKESEMKAEAGFCMDSIEEWMEAGSFFPIGNYQKNLRSLQKQLCALYKEKGLLPSKNQLYTLKKENDTEEYAMKKYLEILQKKTLMQRNPEEEREVTEEWESRLALPLLGIFQEIPEKIKK